VDRQQRYSGDSSQRSPVHAGGYHFPNLSENVAALAPEAAASEDEINV
jgi:hypothetical protein